MKKTFLFFTLFLFGVTFAQACDICGCGAGNSYIGILPEFSKQIFGIRYRYNFLRSHVGAGGATTYLTTDESYRTAEVWTGWTIKQKYRLMLSVPLNFDEKKTLTEKESKTGLGDVNLSAWYQPVNSRKTIGKKLFVQSLWLGAGIKLPTGKYETEGKTEINEAANLFQLGTGSTDFTLNAMYDARLNDAGLNIAAAYKINTENSSKYQYGNKFTVNAQAYYKLRIKKKILLAPNAGLLAESSQKDFDKGFTAYLSGGNLLMGAAGMEVSFKKVAIGANFQTPLSQNLAEGFIHARNRGMVHMAFVF